MPNLLMLASGVGLARGKRRSLGTRAAAGRSPLLRWSYFDRRHLELVFGRRLGRDRDRTLASYLGSCRHARSSLRATIVSTVTGASAGRTFSSAAVLAVGDRINVGASDGRRIRDRLKLRLREAHLLRHPAHRVQVLGPLGLHRNEIAAKRRNP